MVNLLETAELAWNQLFPQPTDEVLIDKEDFYATAKQEYAYQIWRKSKEEKAQEGQFNIPSYLIVKKELDVVDGKINISKLKALTSLDNDGWLLKVGDINCSCSYVKSDFNMSQLMCDDDSLGDGVKTYYILGEDIYFPKGVHAKKLPVVYAGFEKVDGMIPIDASLAKIIRDYLVQQYGGKVGVADVTNNSNPNQ